MKARLSVDRREENLLHVQLALQLLREAQKVLRAAGASRAAGRVALARKSVEGAGRHAERMLAETIAIDAGAGR